MPTERRSSIEVTERGDLYFVYRPIRERYEPGGLLGIRKEDHGDFQPQKEAADKKKKTTITSESFDERVVYKMGGFFDEEFLPTMKKLVEAGLSHDKVKKGW